MFNLEKQLETGDETRREALDGFFLELLGTAVRVWSPGAHRSDRGPYWLSIIKIWLKMSNYAECGRVPTSPKRFIRNNV